MTNAYKIILMTQDQLKELPEYSCTIPTGVYPGKVWKRRIIDGKDEKWIICTFEVESDQETYPDTVRNGYYTPVIGVVRANFYKNRGGAMCWKDIVPPEGTPYD